MTPARHAWQRHLDPGWKPIRLRAQPSHPAARHTPSIYLILLENAYGQ